MTRSSMASPQPLAFEEQLIKNVKEYAAIEEEALPAGLNEDGVFLLSRERAERSRGLMHDTNAIIEAHLMPVFLSPETLTDEEADRYYAFALRLYSIQQQIDIGLAYPLHEALLKRARALGSVDGIVRHQYWKGMILLKWCKTHLFTDMALEAFQEAASYKDRYHEIDDADTRMLINKSLGNVYVTLSGRRADDPDSGPFFDAVDQARRFWSDPIVRERDPAFPFDAFVLNSHQNTCSWIDRLRLPQHYSRDLAERVYESTLMLYGNDEKLLRANPHDWPANRTVYMLTGAQYHTGRISMEEAIHNLTRLFDGVEMSDYSSDGIYGIMHISGVLFTYLDLNEDMTEQERLREKSRIAHKVIAYCQGIPKSVDKYTVNNYISGISPCIAIDSDIRRYINTMLRLTTFRHLPTYVHSMVVGEIMHILTHYFIQNAPERLIGVCGAQTAQQVKDHATGICEEVRLAGLAHDAGKIIYLNTISLCSRKISDLEYMIIREHAERGYGMFAEFEECLCVLDVIRGHHKWYDGTRGYPEDFDNTQSPYKFIIDMASVADSIDAATDSVGRSYAPPHTLDHVIGEVLQQAGTRYSPVIADALKDPLLVAQISHAITNGRKQAYFTAYQEIYEGK